MPFVISKELFGPDYGKDKDIKYIYCHNDNIVALFIKIWDDIMMIKNINAHINWGDRYWIRKR